MGNGNYLEKATIADPAVEVFQAYNQYIGNRL